ncbi:MAG: hypothetical protein ACFFFG_11145 [Candidatus Thorarchaeota archaeon]
MDEESILPFINVSYMDVLESLGSPESVIRLLKTKKINPKEADFLEILGSYIKSQNETILNTIRDLCNIHFGDQGDDAFEKIKRFLEGQTRVAWVIFSRHYHKIDFDDRNPLEDYHPRMSEVIIVHFKYKVM